MERVKPARGVAFGVVIGAIAIGIHGTVDFNLQISPTPSLL